MNITKLGCRGSKTTHRKLDDESILSLLTAGNTQTLIEKVREKLQSAIPDKSYKFIQRIPRLIFAGIFKMDGERLLLKEYTGCVLLEINHLKGLEEARELRAQIAAYPQTLWGFCGGKRAKCEICSSLYPSRWNSAANGNGSGVVSCACFSSCHQDLRTQIVLSHRTEGTSSHPKLPPEL